MLAKIKVRHTRPAIEHMLMSEDVWSVVVPGSARSDDASEQVKTGQKSWSWLPRVSDAHNVLMLVCEKSVKPCRSACLGTLKEQKSYRREPMTIARSGGHFMGGAVPRRDQDSRRRRCVSTHTKSRQPKSIFTSIACPSSRLSTTRLL
jgi:hypothetical protein